MNSGFFSGNRERLSRLLNDHSVLILFSGKSVRVSTHEKYDFRPNKHFYYMTGITESSCYYMMYRMDNRLEEWLFINRPDAQKESWEGKMLSASKAAEQSGIANIGYLDEFEASVRVFSRKNAFHVLYLNERDHPDDDRRKLEALISSESPLTETRDVYWDMCKLRTIKRQEEVNEIRKSIDVLYTGLKAMMTHVRPGMMEYELEARYDFELRTRGVKRGSFKTILASGSNATILHYIDNNARIEGGSLVLVDFDVECGQYHCDLTRVFPVNGTFTERQKQLYQLVLDVQKEVIGFVKPGVTFGELNDYTRDLMATKCQAMHLISSVDELSRYYFHNVGHHLGLDTHDVGEQSPETVICAGMVLTVEPGLYIPEESIGIRIEDNVYVHEDGCEVLSEHVMKEIEDIERFMANHNHKLANLTYEE